MGDGDGDADEPGGTCMAGPGEADPAGSGLAASDGGSGGGELGDAAGIVGGALGVGGEPVMVVGKGRGDQPAAGLVEVTGATLGPTGPGWPVVGEAGSGLGVGIPVADSPAVPGSAEERPGLGGRRRTWMETAERARKAIAPADITITGTVLPAGWERTSVPSWPTVVLTRSASSASASCAWGNGGQ